MNSYLKGSCHCGNIRYIFKYNPSIETYRCNCTICHKTGSFHMRPSPTDFTLLSPTDLSTLGDYTVEEKVIHFYFCKTCGVRCFSMIPQGHAAEKDLSEFNIDGLNGKQLVWQPNEGTTTNSYDQGTYLSINGSTIDAGQDFDMIKLVDDGHVQYGDMLHHDNPLPDSNKPHVGGCY